MFTLSPGSSLSDSQVNTLTQIAKLLSGIVIKIPISQPRDIEVGIAHKNLWYFEHDLLSARIDLFVAEVIPGEFPQPLVELSVSAIGGERDVSGIVKILADLEICLLEESRLNDDPSLLQERGTSLIKGEFDTVGFLHFSNLKYGSEYKIIAKLN